MQNVNRFLETVWAHEHADLHLPTVFRDARPSEAEDVIEAMYVLGERRISRGDPVGVEEISSAVQGLIADHRVLDAAVDVCMHGLTSSGYTEIEAQRFLMESTSSMGKRDASNESESVANLLIESVRRSGQGAERLPRDFGPMRADGRHRYELRRLIGHGSQGSVFEALDRAFAEQDSAAFVALKIFHQTQEKRHTQEGSRVRRIRNKNIARVIDQGVTEHDELYVAYELIEGLTLERWRSHHEEELTPKSACRIMISIAHGVQSAHNAGIVHRDLKPANILVNREGDPIVTDFGIAYSKSFSPQAYRNGTRGSLAFMAPEQFDGVVAGPMPSVDIYALGGILFWMVTGQYPNGDTVPTAVEWLEDRCDGGPSRVVDWGVDERLHSIITKSLSVDPARRYQSVESFACDLESYLEYRSIPWLDRSPLVRTALFTKRNPFVVVSSVVILAAIAVAVGVWVNARSTLRIERAEAAAAIEVESLQSQLTLERARIEEIKEKSALLRSLVQTWSGVLNAGDDQGRIGTDLLFLYTVSLNDFVRDDPAFLADLLAKKTQVGEQFLDRLVADSASPLQIAMWHEVLAAWYEHTDDARSVEHLRATLQLLHQYAPDDEKWIQRVQELNDSLIGSK